MTAPVVREQAVAPVAGTSAADGAPEPTDARVRLRTVPPALAAAIRYSGRWTESGFEEHRDRLLAAVSEAGLTPVGAPRWLRFDPPVKPWFLRRNEVVVDVVEPDGGGANE